MSCAKNENGERTNKTVFIEFDRNDSSQLFKPAIRVQELVEENKENKTDLIVAKKMAEKSRCSYIFGESSREVFTDSIQIALRITRRLSKRYIILQ